MEPRLQRLQLETLVIEQHSNKLENKEPAQSKPADSAADTEASNPIMLMYRAFRKFMQPADICVNSFLILKYPRNPKIVNVLNDVNQFKNKSLETHNSGKATKDKRKR